MTDRPMIFSAPMIRALLDGRKTQTRRLMKPQPYYCDGLLWWDWSKHQGSARINPPGIPSPEWLAHAPYKVGDRVWGRETCRAEELPDSGWDGVRFKADNAFIQIENSPEASDAWSEMFHYRRKRGAWVSGVHMPRWASRITLVVTDVWPERVQDISEEDARAEGTQEPSLRDLGGDLAQAAWSERQVFQRLWNSIYGPDAWFRNPWVWRIAFTVHARNIDRMEEGQ